MKLVEKLKTTFTKISKLVKESFVNIKKTLQDKVLLVITLASSVLVFMDLINVHFYGQAFLLGVFIYVLLAMKGKNENI